MALRFYNSLSQQLEPFTPQDGKTVRMYTCGPTVYNFAHIGNLRTYLFEDILQRALEYNGYEINVPVSLPLHLMKMNRNR